ncbi:hypothetical protein DSO57_1005161 [Entomophthora muscae]|uniref:Uncharacterized protein n=1 Tax=Entomophthora muscae TaxID=34485 RepID=A0ACC2TVQ7_9FUNG|nr:hypothetical protein DSO57_1005161 [Entomophthora muscae]
MIGIDFASLITKKPLKQVYDPPVSTPEAAFMGGPTQISREKGFYHYSKKPVHPLSPVPFLHIKQLEPYIEGEYIPASMVLIDGLPIPEETFNQLKTKQLISITKPGCYTCDGKGP